MSPIEKFKLLKAEKTLTDEILLSFYDTLPSVSIDQALGRWKGGDFQTGHWGNAALAKMKWYGKWYRGRLDAVPLVCYDEQNKLTSNQAMKGEASLWPIEFRGKVSTTMVYDGVPIFDHLRKIDDNTLFGIMDGKPFDGPFPDIVDKGKYYFFYLERVDSFPAEFV